MNILVIGNGFDLAHGLPTKYEHFLEWIVDQMYFYDYLSLEKSDIVQNIPRPKLIIPQSKMRERCSQRVPHQQEIWQCINDNFWLEYFLQCDMYQKKDWIDFESEISRVIRSVEDDMPNSSLKENETVRKCTNSFLQKKFINDFEQLEQERLMQANEEMYKIEKSEGVKWNVEKESEYLDKYMLDHPIDNLKNEITYKDLITKLENDLDRLIRVLEIYITEFVGGIDVTKRSRDIEDINPTHVLSFNYSNTYEKIYGNDNIKYDYIHGKACATNKIETNNMVLGINEYLPNDRKDEEIEFIAFKKFYQRTYKETGCKYKNWVDQIKTRYQDALTAEKKFGELKNYARLFNNNKMVSECEEVLKEAQKRKKEMHNLYIFGHSLDVTDKDVLRDLILNDNVKTKIFYFSKKDLKAKIANLVKVIGQDELIRRTGGSTKTIEFKLQQDM